MGNSSEAPDRYTGRNSLLSQADDSLNALELEDRIARLTERFRCSPESEQKEIKTYIDAYAQQYHKLTGRRYATRDEKHHSYKE